MSEHWLLEQLSLNHTIEHVQKPKLANYMSGYRIPPDILLAPQSELQGASHSKTRSCSVQWWFLLCYKGRCHLRFSGFCPLRGYPPSPTPLTELVLNSRTEGITFSFL